MRATEMVGDSTCRLVGSPRRASASATEPSAARPPTRSHVAQRRIVMTTLRPPVFEGFEPTFIDTGETTIRVRHGGSGPPVLLLRGHPQTTRYGISPDEVYEELRA